MASHLTARHVIDTHFELSFLMAFQDMASNICSDQLQGERHDAPRRSPVQLQGNPLRSGVRYRNSIQTAGGGRGEMQEPCEYRKVGRCRLNLSGPR
jgi:hypothetical protein